MSDVENALTGADAAPESIEADKAVDQENPQVSADADPDAQKEEQARDEKGKFVQKRINELTREKHEARRQAEQAARERDEFRAELARYRQSAAPDPNENLPDYVRHLAREEAMALVEQERSHVQQTQEQQRWTELSQGYAEREREYAAKNPDYETAVDSFASIVGVNPPLAELLMTSDAGPQVAHYLGNHLDEAVRIAQMPPHLLAREVTRLESRLTAQKPKPVTQAPNPTPTLGGGSVINKDPDRMTTDEWLAWRRAQL